MLTFDELVENAEMVFQKQNAPGFVIGLSGSDSVLSFMVCAEAMKRLGKADKVSGIHYPKGSSIRIESGNDELWFIQEILPWLREKYPDSYNAWECLSTDDDYVRWGNIMSRAISQNLWVIGSLNATEEMLGTYSNAMKMVSFLPIVSVPKSQVLELCKKLKVPEIVTTKSLMPDCACGRDQLELTFPELTDTLIFGGDLSKFDPYWVDQVRKFVGETMDKNDFKRSIPWRG